MQPVHFLFIETWSQTVATYNVTSLQHNEKLTIAKESYNKINNEVCESVKLTITRDGCVLKKCWRCNSKEEDARWGAEKTKYKQ